MATQYTYPGVYIEEPPPAIRPIQGVGTSTAGFIGPAANGDVDTPTKLTSMDDFTAIFGAEPLDGHYLWYAVRGYFQNGGQVCYIVRASNGQYSSFQLTNPQNLPLIDVRARALGDLVPPISVQVTAASLVAATIYRPQSSQYTVTNTREIQLQQADLAAQYRPGDSVNLGNLGDHVIVRIVGTFFRFGENLNAAINTQGNIRMSDSFAGTKTFRLASANPIPAGSLVPGTMLTFAQGGTHRSQIVDSVQTEYLQTNPAITTYRVTLRRPFDATFAQANQTDVNSNEFNLQVAQSGTMLYANLSIDPAHPRYYEAVVNGDPLALVRVSPVQPPPPSAPPDNLPAAMAAAANLTGGNNETLSGIGLAEYTRALASLEQISDVNQIAAPDCVLLTQADAQSVQQAVITHCEQMGDRFAVLDSGPGLPLFTPSPNIETWRAALDSARGYAALYYPWLTVPPVRPGPLVLLPPSGHVCGVMARVDQQRGVHKAPANEIVNDALGVELNMSNADQGQINILGINAIRQFPGHSRPIIWGARTTSSDVTWQYVNVRRLFLFLEKSISEGIRWAVFEPNNTGLWHKLNRSITDFLTRVWRDGALFGTKPEEAFFVRIDETLNPDSSRALGRLYIEIGVRPSYPAEFIIVRIMTWQGGAQFVES